MGENGGVLEIQDGVASEESGPTAEPRVRKIFSDLKKHQKLFQLDRLLFSTNLWIG